ncbi:unnamed protein product [Ostreobium quekettii]|uniref:Adenylosuccinate synthetase, chloroplastic n=1 Tax=Ostreobium quekettii TaxID=121088 RepID=A0A8S1IKG1_9CHLO|nr:unnamed protein product [Ostreobium quekettii]|eukprot:evm.model.scf_209.11 EVM.evm.TU.scf_209.11   scf_209:71654-74741(-)
MGRPPVLIQRPPGPASHLAWLRVVRCPASLAGRRCAYPQRRPIACAAASAASGETFGAQVCTVLGTQWGDEGKGKLVDILAQQYDVVARAQGGANAGHTIYDPQGNKYALHLVPSGILNEDATCVIGNGVVVHLPGLFEELDSLISRGVNIDGRLILSDRAHLLFDLHKEVDGLREAELAGKKIGTTGRGIGPAYASKANRLGLRVCDLKHLPSFGEKLTKLMDDATRRFDGALKSNVDEEVERYKGLAKRALPYVGDTVSLINDAYEDGKRILIEGGQATLLDLDFGTYPFVTSSNPSIGGVTSGLGLPPSKIEALIGVVKAYTTRVGSGPYPTEIMGQLGDELRQMGGEYGTTTGRPRRIGWLDMVALRYVCRINGLTHLNLTKLDVLSSLDVIKIGTTYKAPDSEFLNSVPAALETLESIEVGYEELPGWKTDISSIRKWDDLPANAQKYVERIEELAGVPVHWIGVGPGRDAMVVKPL